jgi:hypothetical protein
MDWMDKLKGWHIDEDGTGRTAIYGHFDLWQKYQDSLETIDELQADLDDTDVLFTEMSADIVRLTNIVETNPFIRMFEFFKSFTFQSPIVRK